MYRPIRGRSRCASSAEGDADEAAWAFERAAVLVCGDGGCFVGALQEGEQGGFRIGGGSDGFVGEQELAQRFAEERVGGLYGEVAEAGGYGVGVGIKCGEIGAVAAGPEAGAADFV